MLWSVFGKRFLWFFLKNSNIFNVNSKFWIPTYFQISGVNKTQMRISSQLGNLSWIRFRRINNTTIKQCSFSYFFKNVLFLHRWVKINELITSQLVALLFVPTKTEETHNKRMTHHFRWDEVVRLRLWRKEGQHFVNLKWANFWKNERECWVCNHTFVLPPLLRDFQNLVCRTHSCFEIMRSENDRRFRLRR